MVRNVKIFHTIHSLNLFLEMEPIFVFSAYILFVFEAGDQNNEQNQGKLGLSPQDQANKDIGNDGNKSRLNGSAPNSGSQPP